MRISRDEWALRLAEVTALRGTCLRRRVGCVLTDADGVVLATGYNGVARGVPHCNEEVVTPAEVDNRTPLPSRHDVIKTRWTRSYPNACPGASAPSGAALDSCLAVHAEMNAIIQCRDAHRIHACYATVSPCVNCTKVLLNTGAQRIVFREPYPHPSEALWVGLGREWVRLPAGG